METSKKIVLATMLIAGSVVAGSVMASTPQSYTVNCQYTKTGAPDKLPLALIAWASKSDASSTTVAATSDRKITLKNSNYTKLKIQVTQGEGGSNETFKLPSLTPEDGNLSFYNLKIKQYVTCSVKKSTGG